MYGPNFSMDEDSGETDELFAEAIENARKKAQNVAASTGRKLGKVLSVVEGVTSGGPVPILRMEAGGGGAPLEPGTGTVSKSVTVVFELR